MPVAAQVIPMFGSADEARSGLLDQVTPALERTQLRAVGHDIIVAVYDRAGKKTAGGIIIADTNEEDRHQGKIGLVLSVGPMCAKHPDWLDWFGGTPPKVGDWVGLNIRDGHSFLLGKSTCRSVEWKYLRMQLDVPDLVM